MDILASLNNAENWVMGRAEAVWTGTRDAYTQEQQEQDLRADILRAGGTSADADAAVSEQQHFVNSYWSSSSPVSKVAKALGLGGEIDSGYGSGTGISILTVALLIGAVIVVKEVMEA